MTLFDTAAGVLRPAFHGLACALAIVFVCAAARAEEAGRFEGRVVVEWMDDEGSSRNMRLLEEFTFVDPSGKRWVAPVGAVVNGASIPHTFWSLFGAPFVGSYRRASVVHDYYCEARSEPWRDVHLMFYEATRAAGVDEVTAKMMYAAIYGGGPRWTAPGPDRTARPRLLPQRELTDESARALQEWIRSEDPDLDALERRVEQYLVTPTEGTSP
jgi:hypothetical protein